MIFKASDIKKVKSVKRDNGTAWAYFDDGYEDKFKLNFSSTQVKGGRELQFGDVILLFQNVDKIPGVRPRTYMTHLVTPIGSVIKKNLEINHRWNWELEVGVIARAEPRIAIYSTPDILSFHKPNWGKICDIRLLNTDREINDIQSQIWDYFKPFINPHLDKLFESPVITENDVASEFGVNEGKEFEYIKKHLGRERNGVIVGLAKSRAFEFNNGRLLCSCCDFDFISKYGEHGRKFIEAHHKIPISTGGERRTTIEDLALVCSNCHRMLHRKNARGKYFTIEELRLLVNSNS